MKRVSLSLLLVGWVACSTDPQGTPVELSFGDVEVVAAGGADAGSGGSGGSFAGLGGNAASVVSTLTASATSAGGTTGGGGQVQVSYGPPVVDQMSPNAGPWGTRVTVTGTDLGSSNRAGSQLLVGSDLTLTPTSSEVESWQEQRVVFRVPFPHAGEVVLETGEGNVVAGTFTPAHEVVAEYPVASDVEVLASVSLDPGSISLALSSDPISIVTFDGDSWLSQTLPEQALRPESLRLFGDAGSLAGFALTTDSPPELLSFEYDGSEWQSENTGLVLTERTLVAGGPDGGSVWYLASGGWYRARPTAGVWSVDKGPMPDIFASSKLPTAGATSDGALWVARALETGTILNDKGAPFARYLGPDDDTFQAEYKIGDDLDDTIVELEVFDRGRGLVVNYCGADANAIGAGSDDIECRTGLVLGNGSAIRSTNVEGSGVRHALAFDAREAVTCTSGQETMLSGAVWSWPCLNVAALEIDANQAAIAVFRRDGNLLILRRR